MSAIKLGLGLYRHMLNEDNYRFARQCGATHIVAHLVEYFSPQGTGTGQPVGDRDGWGHSIPADKLWTRDALSSLRAEVEAAGLILAAIENFEPAHWHDVLLDGPRKHEQLERLKQIVTDVGAAGIPVIGYNFSIAGVAGRLSGPFARGGAISTGMDEVDESPVPNGMVWNMIWDPTAAAGSLPEITHDELWRRLGDFLDALLPVAERVGVRLAAHPDDPPAAYVRRQPRLVYQPAMYQRLLNLHPSSANKLEFCLGTLAEMTDGDVYETTRHHAAAGDIAYIHFRNVEGKVPRYRETFIDDGNIDMVRIMRILKDASFDGVLIPDHAPLMTCAAPWHASMAHALGYVRALEQAL